MRSKFLVQSVLLVLVATFALSGCGWFKGKKKPATGAEAAIPPIGGADIGMGSRPILTGEGLVRGQFANIYFDYDSSRIRPGEISKLESVAVYMRSNPGNLLIEGHCDERGTAEYNRALGERRALAAREELVRMGVDPNRISTISYGKDRPADFGHDEAAHAKNRRCEFLVAPR
jgi:peptidoglycan-associated lipoprotein